MKIMPSVLSGALAAAAVLTSPLPASSQDWRLDPAFGSIRLQTGFLPDPHRKEVRSGGRLDASRLGGRCTGMIAAAPDYRVQYQSGRYPLTISGTSRADTTLVVNGPDGRWYCNDDADGLNPSITFRNPQSGQYDIWVGTYGSTSYEPTILSVSEVGRR